MGYEANYWETNVNPQQDPYSVNIEGAGYEWVRDIATETDLLMYQYKDANKKNRYGALVPNEQREDVWYFDQFHEDLEGISLEGISPTYMPNQVQHTIDFEHAIGIANYSVLQTYNMHFKNVLDQDKTLKFYLESNGAAIVRSENLDKPLSDDPKNINPEIKEKTALGDTVINEEYMATMYVPAHGEANYKLSVVLVTGSNGSIRNFFRVR